MPLQGQQEHFAHKMGSWNLSSARASETKTFVFTYQAFVYKSQQMVNSKFLYYNPNFWSLTDWCSIPNSEFTITKMTAVSRFTILVRTEIYEVPLDASPSHLAQISMAHRIKSHGAPFLWWIDITLLQLSTNHQVMSWYSRLWFNAKP